MTKSRDARVSLDSIGALRNLGRLRTALRKATIKVRLMVQDAQKEKGPAEAEPQAEPFRGQGYGG